MGKLAAGAPRRDPQVLIPLGPEPVTQEARPTEGPSPSPAQGDR